MTTLIFFYLVLPFALAALVLRLIKKYGGDPTPQDVRAFCQAHPIEKGFYRALKRDRAGVWQLGVFEKEEDATDAAFAAAKSADAAAADKAMVLDSKGQIVRQFKP